MKSKVIASELRIGNLIFVNNPEYWPEIKGIPLKVSSYNGDRDTQYFPESSGSVNASELNGKFNYCQFDEFIAPIPLTVEWLLKFGYRRGSMKNCYIKEWGRNGVEIIVHDYHYKGGFEVQLSESKYKSVESVHQLQNLFFALTGEELVVPKDYTIDSKPLVIE